MTSIADKYAKLEAAEIAVQQAAADVARLPSAGTTPQDADHPLSRENLQRLEIALFELGAARRKGWRAERVEVPDPEAVEDPKLRQRIFQRLAERLRARDQHPCLFSKAAFVSGAA